MNEIFRNKSRLLIGRLAVDFIQDIIMIGCSDEIILDSSVLQDIIL